MTKAGNSQIMPKVPLLITTGHCKRGAAIKTRMFIATAILLLTFVASAAAKYSGGTGEPNDPYQIASAEDLMLLGESPEDYDKQFILTDDIDLDPNLPGRKVFDKAVIAPDVNDTEDGFQGTSFAGVFDGNGHRILHLTIMGRDYVGLFGQSTSGAEVRNLSVVDVNITDSGYGVGGVVGNNGGLVTDSCCTGAVRGSSSIGVLVGFNGGYYGPSNAVVTNCYSMGEVIGNGSSCGGLVGFNWGNISRCYSTGRVRSTGDDVGGLVGSNAAGMRHCYSAGAVSARSSVGGLIGRDLAGLVTQCYSTGMVSGGRSTGGLIASALDSSVIGCLWDVQTSGQTTSHGGTGKTTAEMQHMQTYQDTGWDFVGQIEDGTSEVWQMPPEGGYPSLAILTDYTPPQLEGTGTSEDPYLISNALKLGAMVYYNPWAYYQLAVSMDLSGIRWGASVVPWFEGTFNGSGHTISNLTIKGEEYLGLFGRLAPGAEVKDLGVVDANLIGSGGFVGALVGVNSGDVTRCYSTGTIRGATSVGGLVGYGSSDIVTGSSKVTDCYSESAVSGTGDWRSARGKALSGIGGLVGYSYVSYITRFYSTGTVRGDLGVGGLAGYTYSGQITQCYSTSVSSGSSGFVGGLVGYGLWTIVNQCYSTGRVEGATNIGGLVGGGIDPRYVRGCFWDTQTSGQAISAGGMGKTTAEMQTAGTFLEAGWDFVDEMANGTEDIWWINEGKDYPRLWWEASDL